MKLYNDLSINLYHIGTNDIPVTDVNAWYIPEFTAAWNAAVTSKNDQNTKRKENTVVRTYYTIPKDAPVVILREINLTTKVLDEYTEEIPMRM